MPSKLKKYPRLQIVLSMAMSRDKWIDRVDNLLEGALREYSKQKFSELIGYRGHDWTAEIKALLSKVQGLLDPTETKTKVKFDRLRAFEEAFHDALAGGQSKVVEAKNILITKHSLSKVQYNKLHRTLLDAGDLLPSMVKEYLGIKIRR